jgi:hypothetical protein
MNFFIVEPCSSGTVLTIKYIEQAENKSKISYKKFELWKK